MKVAIERAVLLKALGHVQRVVDRRNVIPVLGNVMIRATRDGVVLRATDLDMEMQASIPAATDVEGLTTVPATLLYEIVRKIPEGLTVTIETSGDQGQATVRAGRSRFSLATLPEADLPTIAFVDAACRFSTPATDLKRLITKVQFAMSTEETRYYLNGIYLHLTSPSFAPMLTAVATDGHRLAKAVMPCPDMDGSLPYVIVPRKAVTEMLRLLDDRVESVGIELSQTKLRLTAGGVTVTSKLIDGTFPDYQRVIPDGNDVSFHVASEPFRTAVDRVATISSEKTRTVRFALSQDALVLTVQSNEAGSAVEELEGRYEGPGMTVGFNARYLLDIANQVDGPETMFRLSDARAPAIIQDEQDPSSLYVLMPLAIH